MVNIKDYIAYLQKYPESITAIKKIIFVVNESQLTDYMRNLKKEDFPLMIIVIPSADAQSPDPDNICEMNHGLIYILKKFDATGYTPQKMIDDFDETQQVMELVKEKWYDDAHSECNPITGNLDAGSFHMDPEYNYLGCNGWSVSFKFQTQLL